MFFTATTRNKRCLRRLLLQQHQGVRLAAPKKIFEVYLKYTNKFPIPFVLLLHMSEIIAVPCWLGYWICDVFVEYIYCFKTFPVLCFVLLDISSELMNNLRIEQFMFLLIFYSLYCAVRLFFLKQIVRFHAFLPKTPLFYIFCAKKNTFMP